MDRVSIIKSHAAMRRSNINWGRVIATEVYDNSIKGYIKSIVKCLVYDFSVKFYENNDNELYFYYSLDCAKRNDYDWMKDKFISLFPNFSFVNVTQYFTIRNVIRKFRFIIKNFYCFKVAGVPTPFLCSVLYTKYYILYSDFFSSFNFSNTRMIVTFCDARCEDNLFCQLAKNRGVVTATLQHGQYRLLRQGYKNADAEAYENFISDYLFAWGDVTKNEFIRYGIDSSRLLTVGALKPFSYVGKSPAHKKVGVLGLVLSGETYKRSNVSMIEIANLFCKKYGFKYYVRFHPKNNIRDYMKLLNKEFLIGWSSNINNEEYTSVVDFSIIHMTGVFVELLCLNSIIFVYADEFLESIFKLPQFSFGNLVGLEELYKKYEVDEELCYSLQYKLYCNYNQVGNIDVNYINAMKKLLGG